MWDQRPFAKCMALAEREGVNAAEIMAKVMVLAEKEGLAWWVKEPSKSEPMPTNGFPPGFMSGPQLAAELKMTPDAVDGRLRRLREKYPDCYIENDHPRPNEPCYLYRAADVMPHLKKVTHDSPK